MEKFSILFAYLLETGKCLAAKRLRQESAVCWGRSLTACGTVAPQNRTLVGLKPRHPENGQRPQLW